MGLVPPNHIVLMKNPMRILERDGPNASGWYVRLRVRKLTLSVLNRDHLRSESFHVWHFLDEIALCPWYSCITAKREQSSCVFPVPAGVLRPLVHPVMSTLNFCWRRHVPKKSLVISHNNRQFFVPKIATFLGSLPSPLNWKFLEIISRFYVTPNLPRPCKS